MEIISRVGNLYPAYNPFKLVLNSPNKVQTGYKYIIDITDRYTSERVRRLSIPPNSTNSNYGVVEISNIMSNNILGDPVIDRDWGYFGRNYEQYFSSIIDIGEEYLYEWTFLDNVFSTTPPYTSRVGFTGNTAHGFSVGDWVYITQSGTPTHTEYNGVFNVVATPTTSYFIVNYPFLGNTVPEGGTVRYQDFRTTQFTGLTTASTSFFDGVVQDNYHTYDWEAKHSTSLYQFQTILSNPSANTSDYTVRMTNNGFLNIALPDEIDESDILIEVVVHQPAYAARQIGPTTASTIGGTWLLRCPCAPESINEMFGFDWMSGSPTQYSIQLTDSLEVPISEAFYFNVDYTCTPDTQWTELLFEDQLSSFIPYNFRMVTKEVSTINKKTHKRELDYELDSNDNMIYNPSSDGKPIYTIDYDKQISVHTGYIKEAEVDIIEGLIKSKRVLWRSGDEYIPVIITNTEFDKKTGLRNAVEIDYTITFKPQIYGALNI